LTRVILEGLLVMSWAFLRGLLEVEIVGKEMRSLVEGQ
jgi:hypothetical protein